TSAPVIVTLTGSSGAALAAVGRTHPVNTRAVAAPRAPMCRMRTAGACASDRLIDVMSHLSVWKAAPLPLSLSARRWARQPDVARLSQASEQNDRQGTFLTYRSETIMRSRFVPAGAGSPHPAGGAVEARTFRAGLSVTWWAGRDGSAMRASRRSSPARPIAARGGATPVSAGVNS